MKWEDLNAPRTPNQIHERMEINGKCYGAVLSHDSPMKGYFLTIQLGASTSIDAPLAECKREFLATLLPLLEANLDEVKRLAKEESAT